MADCNDLEKKRQILRDKALKNLKENNIKEALENQKESMDLKWEILEKCKED